jgi:hypothetical protein
MKPANREDSAFVYIECQIALLASQQIAFLILGSRVGGYWVRMMLKWAKFA